MHGTHPTQVFLELCLMAIGKVVLICGLLLVALCFVVLGLLFGGAILALCKKKRHLFWTLPLVNFLVFLVLFPIVNNWLDTDQITFSDQFRFPLANLTILAIPVLTLLGWTSAGLLAPVHLILRAFGSSDETSTADAHRFLSDYLARPRSASVWSAFGDGCCASLFGFGYLCRYPRLWRYAILPIVLNLLITGLAVVLFLMALAGFITYLHPVFPPGWGWLLLEILCGVVLLFLAIGATLVTWMVLQAVLCGYYYEKLARQVELQLGMRSEELEGLPVGEQFVDLLLDLAILLAVNIGLLFLHVIPVLGSLIAIVGHFCFTCYILGAAYFGFPLCLRQRHRKQRAVFTRQFRSQTTGLGAAVYVAALLPVIGSVVLTTAVVGAVLLHRRLGGSVGS
ncbi:MAG: hypothetical protein FJ276_19940 [Planctomycetes bacterium]|nr:hypothetical protein [Planctomycetota bacterium]